MKKVYLLFICALVVGMARAQKISRDYKSQPLSSVLEDLNAATDRYDISFVYNDLEDFVVTCSFQNQRIDEALKTVIGLYPVSITKEGDKFFVECVYKTERHLTGTLIDEHGQPVAFANVAVLNPADSTILSGGVSNEGGQFVVPYEQEKVLARITYIGYKTVYRLCTSESMGTIRLQPEAYTISNVTVTGSRPQFKLSSDGLRVNVQGTLLANMGTAFGVLGELPRVTTEGDKVEVYGKGQPEIYINNKKVHDVNELRELKSTDILSVEVISNPGAQYDATVESVIRIKTIKRLADGFSFSSQTHINYNSLLDGYETVKATWRSGRLETFANIDYYNHANKQDIGLTTNIITPHETVRTEQSTALKFRSESASAKVGFSYDLDDNNSLGTSYTLSKSFTGKGRWSGNEQIWLNGQKVGTVESNTDVNRSMGPQHNLDVYYLGKWGKLGVNFDGSYYWSKQNEAQGVAENSSEVENRSVNTQSNNHNRLIAGKLVMSLPVGKGTLSLGSEASLTSTHSLYMSDFSEIPSTDIRVKENHVALFAEYSLPLSQTWNVSGGLRYEHATNEYSSFGQRLDDPSRTYDDLFPNVSLGWTKKKISVSFAYNSRVARPTYRALTRHLQYDSRFLYDGGNPLLHPQFNHNLSINAGYSWLSLQAEYSIQKDKTMQLMNLYNQQAIAFLKWENIDHFRQFAVSVVAAPKLNWYQPQLMLAYSQQFFDAHAYGIAQNLRKPRFYARLQNRFLIGKSAFVALEWQGWTTYSGGPGNYKPMSFANLKFYKGFHDNRWMLNLDFTDILDSYRERWTVYGNGVENEKDGKMFSRQAVLTLTYNFNQKRSKYRGTGAGEDEKSRF
ncbi:MAG: TonB-dependent receptor [Prevotella sp.]|nr:TonB-dependent receptor [Prevotella sp.]